MPLEGRGAVGAAVVDEPRVARVDLGQQRERAGVEGLGGGVVGGGGPVDRLDGAPGQQVGGQLGVGGQPLAQRLLDPVEVVQQDGGVGRALVAVAGGRARHQGVDVVGDAGLDQRRHRHVVVDVAVGHLDR